MANSKVDITAGSGIEIDTETESTDGQHRQVVVLGDPATKAGVAPVDGTAGLKVDLGTDNDVTVTSGAVTATLSATDNDVLDNIQTSVDTVAAAVSTEMQVDIVGITPDLALGTDISAVFGANSLILATQADNLANGSDGLQTTSMSYVFDGTAWDRMRGDSVDGLLVNMGTNNDVTVTSGTVDLGETDNAVLDAIAADTATMAAAVSTEVQVDIVGITPDLALGTDISGVFGAASLIQATQADDVANTTDTLLTSAFGYVFDGSTWDRLPGDSANGVTVNLGTNNDVTVTGTVTADLGANNDVTIDASSVVATEDGASGGAAVGIPPMAVRDDTLSALTPVEGDFVPLRVNNTGALHVTGGGGGTEYTDDTSTHATGSSAGNLMMAAAVPTDTSIDANDIGSVAMSTDRRLHVDSQIVGQDADVTIADGGNSITVDGTVTVAASENVIGAVVGKTVVHEFVPSISTTSNAAGDVLAATEVVSACFRGNDLPAVLQSITVVDKSDLGVALKIFLLSADVALGTEDAAISITDANADSIMGVIDIEATDWHDLIGSQIAQIRNLSLPIVPASGTDDMYCAIVGVDAHDFVAATDINIRFGILQD